MDIIISRLRLALNKVVALSDNELQLGVSVGTALMSEAEDSESLINLAEARMLEDKSNRQDKGVLTGMS